VRYSPENITTLIMLAFTLWVISTRFQEKPHKSLPLVYYMAVFLYYRILPDRLNLEILYLGAAVSLLLRFEYVGGLLGKLGRIIEIGTMAFVGYEFFRVARF
jgi:hypothetical protein